MEEDQEIDYFSALADDCILHVFDRVSLDDLCHMSVTSKKFKKLAEKQFERRYPELVTETYRIDQGEVEKIAFRETENHLKYFNQKLECVTIGFRRKTLDERQLTDFFRQLSAIKRFVCTMRCPNTEWMRQILKVVARSVIEELFIACPPSGEIDFSLIRDEFKALDERENFKRLELKLVLNEKETKNLSELASLKSFTGFHIHYSSNHLDPPQLELFSVLHHIPEIDLFTNLTTLEIQCCVKEWIILTLSVSLSHKLLNLEEIYYNDHRLIDFQRILIPFIRNTPKINKIFIINNLIEEEEFDIPELNMERSLLKDATKLTIFLPMEKQREYITMNNGESKDLVNIKRISFTSSSEYTSNPLTDISMDGTEHKIISNI